MPKKSKKHDYLENKKFLVLLSSFATVLVIVIFAWIFVERSNAPSFTYNSQGTKADQTSDTTKKTLEPSKSSENPLPTQSIFNKALYSTSDPSSIWVVVNKKHALPAVFAPNDLTSVLSGQLRVEAAGYLKSLVAEAKNAGYPLSVISSYRSYTNQQATYNGWVARDGQTQADTYSARPGHSEHQTGLAVDLGNGTCDLETCFGDTPTGRWLASNAYNYGFIVRYPNEKTDITGYQYEPWHLRYVGLELASEMQKNNVLTLEEFFGISGGVNY